MQSRQQKRINAIASMNTTILKYENHLEALRQRRGELEKKIEAGSTPRWIGAWNTELFQIIDRIDEMALLILRMRAVRANTEYNAQFGGVNQRRDKIRAANAKRSSGQAALEAMASDW